MSGKWGSSGEGRAQSRVWQGGRGNGGHRLEGFREGPEQVGRDDDERQRVNGTRTTPT